MISIGGLNIHLYGLLIGIAVLTAWEIAHREANKKRITEKYFNQITLVTIFGGVLGARAYHVAHYWQNYYTNNVLNIFYLWEGGLGIWGAIVGGIFFLWLYHVLYSLLNNESRVNLLDYIDSVIIGLPLAQAIGRLGNFFNNELWGKNGEPLFFYEGLLNTLLFLVLFKLNTKNNKPGRNFGIYLLGYGCIRLFLDHLRSAESIWSIQGISVATSLSGLAMLLGIWFIFRGKQS